MGLAERCLDPAEASRLELLTATPDETEDASPGAGGYWSEAFQRLVATLRLRAAMLAELAGPSGPVERTEPDRRTAPAARPAAPAPAAVPVPVVPAAAPVPVVPTDPTKPTDPTNRTAPAHPRIPADPSGP